MCQSVYPDPCPVCGSHQTIVQVKPVPNLGKIFKVVCISCHSHGPEAESYSSAVQAARQTGAGVWTHLTKQDFSGPGKGHQLLDAVSKLAEGYTPATGRMDEARHFVTDGKKNPNQYYSGNEAGLRIGKILEDPSSKTGLKVFLDEEDNTWKARVEWLNVISPDQTGQVSDIPLTKLRQIYWVPNTTNLHRIKSLINWLGTPFFKTSNETDDNERTYIP